jgi:hypothetical protein
MKKLGDWKNRVLETLESCIRLHVEDTDELPSGSEYEAMVRHSLETTEQSRSSRWATYADDCASQQAFYDAASKFRK